ncbi:hypothetical protein [Burkholderia sp. BCC1993]|uniref:hypothetical protein n=1 Tax=Burkholderia sp. BCC1993 TaxID=2817444 RepID=UPI002AB2877F|nr:hypothetical protein [Burkholderia sp. BCC1993]
MRGGDAEYDLNEPGRGRVRALRPAVLSVGWGNCSGTSDFPVDDSDPDDIRPIGPDGARFRFVAGVRGWEYRAMGADWILLFYEPISRVALLTFDWS